MEDNYFTAQRLVVPVGVPILVTAHNEGQAVHNWNVAGVTKTELLQHGQTQVVTFTIASPGTFNYVCDVHPKEMTGVLVAQ
jgi:plastocyanin